MPLFLLDLLIGVGKDAPLEDVFAIRFSLHEPQERRKSSYPAHPDLFLALAHSVEGLDLAVVYVEVVGAGFKLLVHFRSQVIRHSLVFEVSNFLC